MPTVGGGSASPEEGRLNQALFALSDEANRLEGLVDRVRRFTVRLDGAEPEAVESGSDKNPAIDTGMQRVATLHTRIARALDELEGDIRRLEALY